jgi:Uncharacterized protein conserved in bacteria (DUF2252)
MSPRAKSVSSKSIPEKTTSPKFVRTITTTAATSSWRLREDPPVLTHVDEATREKIIDGLNEYAESLSLERRYMLSRVAGAGVGAGVKGARIAFLREVGDLVRTREVFVEMVRQARQG